MRWVCGRARAPVTTRGAEQSPRTCWTLAAAATATVTSTRGSFRVVTQAWRSDRSTRARQERAEPAAGGGLGCVARLAWRLWAPLELGTPAPRPHEGGAGLSLQGEAPWAERGWTGAGHPHWPTRGPRGFRESQQKNNTLNALCGSCFQNLTRREALGSRWRTSLAWNALESQKRPTPRFGDSTLKAEGGEAEPGRQGGREATGAVRRTD